MKFTDYRTFKTAIGGKLLELEIGKVCELANGQVMVRYGDTVVNVTACASKEPRPDIDFFPLSCDYEEKMYAAGKIPGGFIKREGRPSERAILNSRLMDRPLRPLFPKGFYNDVQVVATVMCVDNDAPSEIAAMIGSSVALAISDIPWDGAYRFGTHRHGGRAVRCQSFTGSERRKHDASGSFRNQGSHHDGRGRRSGSSRGNYPGCYNVRS